MFNVCFIYLCWYVALQLKVSNLSNLSFLQHHTSELKATTEDIFCGDMMVLALISTACISNVIYSLQAMLIYARISNAMEAED